MKRAIVVWLGAWALTVGLAAAHEPIFGVGPHVIGRYGIGLETGLENGEGLHVGLHLGLAADFGASVELERGVDAHAHGEGWGSPRLRTKWRFYRRDGRGRSDQAAIVLGYRFEEGAQPGALLLGATVGRESRVEYFFAGLRYQVEMDRAGSRTLLYDLAVGVRPVRTNYDEPDLVVLLELNGRSGGARRLGVGPGVLLSYRNVMAKGGVNWVLREGSQWLALGERFDSFVAVEVHAAPFAFLYRE